METFRVTVRRGGEWTASKQTGFLSPFHRKSFLLGFKANFIRRGIVSRAHFAFKAREIGSGDDDPVPHPSSCHLAQPDTVLSKGSINISPVAGFIEVGPIAFRLCCTVLVHS